MTVSSIKVKKRVKKKIPQTKRRVRKTKVSKKKKKTYPLSKKKNGN